MSAQTFASWFGRLCLIALLGAMGLRTAATPARAQTDTALQAVAQINQTRLENGLTPLSISAALERAAQRHPRFAAVWRREPVACHGRSDDNAAPPALKRSTVSDLPLPNAAEGDAAPPPAAPAAPEAASNSPRKRAPQRARTTPRKKARTASSRGTKHGKPH